jgi:hypothetical protein
VAEGGGLLNRYTVNSRIVGSNPIPSATHTQSPRRGVSSAKLTVYRPSRGTMEGYYHEGAYATPSALEGKLASS